MLIVMAGVNAIIDIIGSHCCFDKADVIALQLYVWQMLLPWWLMELPLIFIECRLMLLPCLIFYVVDIITTVADGIATQGELIVFECDVWQMEWPLSASYINCGSVMLTRTSSHICGRWYLPMFLFRDGLFLLM